MRSTGGRLGSIESKIAAEKAHATTATSSCTLMISEHGACTSSSSSSFVMGCFQKDGEGMARERDRDREREEEEEGERERESRQTGRQIDRWIDRHIDRQR